MGPLICMGLPSLGRLPMKNVPPRRLRACGLERYDASEWMLRTILYLGSFVGCKVVQEGVDMFFGLFGGLCMFSGDAAEGNECSDVYCSGVVHDGAHNLLNSFDPVGW